MAANDSTRTPLSKRPLGPWRPKKANDARNGATRGETGKARRDVNALAGAHRIGLGVSRGTLRVWSRMRSYRGRACWRFVEHEDVTVKEARELTDGAVGEFVPRYGTPMLMGKDTAALDALRGSGLLMEPEPAEPGAKVGLPPKATALRMAT